ncbi:unnamed protein product [Phytophthora fragariaefolia]|uniref:Unnamed protein product n=1 Tax=Phytophthora fragariaefolia TaxID=1490495 RepID=A0A9W6X7U1_9STRA|nr:unnamed protein product [Phytophthora fragariaefolia]
MYSTSSIVAPSSTAGLLGFRTLTRVSPTATSPSCSTFDGVMQRAHVLVRLRGEAAASGAAGVCRTGAGSVRLEHSDMSPGVASISFEQVFGAQDDTARVFRSGLAPAADAAVDGRRATIVATGAAGSGKSFSCHGGDGGLGVVALAVRRVFSELQRKWRAGWTCNVLLSCWGVTGGGGNENKNETLSDLLRAGTDVEVPPQRDVEQLLLERALGAATADEAEQLYAAARRKLSELETHDFVLAMHVETRSPSGEARRGRLLVVDVQGGSILEPRGQVQDPVEKKQQHFLDAQFPVNEPLSAAFGACVGGTSATYVLVTIRTPAQFQQQVRLAWGLKGTGDCERVRQY